MCPPINTLHISKFQTKTGKKLNEIILPNIREKKGLRGKKSDSVTTDKKCLRVKNVKIVKDIHRHPFPNQGSGHGVYVYENQYFRYEGQWEKGKKHGYGKLLLRDGTYYEGQFTHGEITGHGFKYFATTKCKYKGQFYKGEMHGKGLMMYPDGSEYEGTFVHNRKHGYGIMRTPSELYDGNYEANLRHGAGCMLYIPMRFDKTRNGDKYEGSWVNDKRQGRGVLHCYDGSVYDGEFMDDEFHGQGIYRHISGITYNGSWVHGFPTKMVTKLQIVVDQSPLVIRQGTPFNIEVQCLNDDGEVIETEIGRELQITAGFKYYQPSKGSALFDMIEDVEDKPINTPFGYQVVHYPLTNQIDDSPEIIDEEEKEDELLGSQTNIDTLKDEEDNTGKEGENKETEDKIDDTEKPEEEEVVMEEQIVPNNTSKENESVPLPPAVPSQRTNEGVSTWNNIYLAPAPPMYRPFVAMGEAESGGKKGVTKGKPKGSESNHRRSSVTFSVEKLRKQKEKALEEKYAKTGEYVLMVQDLTNPPFLGRKLEPAFLLLKLKKPEPKKKQAQKELKRWDTSQHIKLHMRATEMEEEEEE